MDLVHQQILEALDGKLDETVFEDCACDLLRDVYPSLVPVRGGHDGGMDGAIADGEGEAYALICTAAQDFQRNLKGSLDSLKRGRHRRKAVFVTSREVTPQKRFKLEEAARDRGFVLVQVIDRHGMAQRLYWSPRWLRDLLGLSGAPSALSVVPRSRRPWLDLEPVGRDEDLAWIRSRPGDLVIAGEPGSGKTFLFSHLIRSGWKGLFLVGEDRGEVRRALLTQRPKTVVVDDSHVHLEMLLMLRQLREEMEPRFSLAATTWTWENDLDRVAAALPEAETRKLRLLPRHQILEIFRQARVRASDEILRDLVDQAANKPGLAATIANLWQRGAWQEILEGKVLRREVLTAFEDSGKEVEDLLAALSLGGDRGMGLESVREFLDLSQPAVRRQAAALAAGGVLGEEKEALSVQPRQLRTSLLRTAFFSGSASSHDYRPLLDNAPSFADAVQELSAVQRAGARIPEIRELVSRAGCDEQSARVAWCQLAESGEEESRWVLEHYPGDPIDIGGTLLHQIPGEVIPRLLLYAVKELGARASRAMNLLSPWIQSPSPLDLDKALHRRRLVARAAKRFLEEGGNPETGVHGICLAMRPNQRGASRDPGFGNTVTYWSNLLPLDGLRQIANLWEEVRGALPALNRTAWQHIESALWPWIHPSNAAPGSPVPEDVGREMPAFALRVLGDLVAPSLASPGLRARLARLAASLGASLPIELDPTFEQLYPESYGEAEPSRQAARLESLHECAAEWARLGPREMAQQLVWYESEADRIGYGWPRGSHEVCRRLAESVAEPGPWLQALTDHNVAGQLVSPFLERLVRERHDGWEVATNACLDLDAYRFAAIDAILKLPGAPVSLVGKALDRAVAWPLAVDTLAMRREMPSENLRAALRHPRWEIALAAAVGEWYAGEEHSMREEFLTDWKEAILAAPADASQTELQYWLSVILSRDPDLALDWLRARLRDPEPATYFLGGPFALAVRALHPDQRLQVVSELSALPILASLLPPIVERDRNLYRHLLAIDRLREYHLVPLSGKPDGLWCELALLALEAGHPPEKVAEAAIWSSGRSCLDYPAVEHWQEWATAFAALENHPRDEMRQAGRHGRKIVDAYLSHTRLEREQIALRGL